MKKVFLTNCRLIDGTGAPAVENAVLVYEEAETLVTDNRILYAGEAELCHLKADKDDTVVDLTGYSILPGLINSHVHLYAMGCGNLETPYITLMYYRHLAESLFTGVTTMRSVGGSDNIDVNLRNAVETGMLWGARLVTCGSPILPHAGHCFHTRGSVQCTGKDEFVRAVREEMGKGVDQIKLMYSGGAGGNRYEGMYNKHITDEEGKAACDIAHMNGKIVSAHLSNDEAVRGAVRCGVDSVEHAYNIDEETAALMAEHNVYYVPTLAITDILKASEDYQAQISAPCIERLVKAHPRHMESAGFVWRAGLRKFCTGTDTIPSDRFDGTWATTYETELLTQIGLSPLEAIKAATSNGAALCGLAGVVGELKAGLVGDIIAVKGKPDENIHDLRNLDMVIHDCRTVFSNVPGYRKEKAFWPFPAGHERLYGLETRWQVN